MPIPRAPRHVTRGALCHACQGLAKVWRLPTIEEGNEHYRRLFTQGGLSINEVNQATQEHRRLRHRLPCRVCAGTGRAHASGPPPGRADALAWLLDELAAQTHDQLAELSASTLDAIEAHAQRRHADARPLHPQEAGTQLTIDGAQGEDALGAAAAARDEAARQLAEHWQNVLHNVQRAREVQADDATSLLRSYAANRGRR